MCKIIVICRPRTQKMHVNINLLHFDNANDQDTAITVNNGGIFYLTRLCLMEFPIRINWTNPFRISGLLGV